MNPWGKRRPRQATGAECLEHAAHYLRLAKAEPDHPAGYADLAEQFTALAIQAGVTRAEVAAYLIAAARGEVSTGKALHVEPDPCLQDVLHVLR
jgi:hypothetical protein